MRTWPTPAFVQTCRGREAYAAYCLTVLPHATLITDTEQNADRNWVRMLRAAGHPGALFFEDDVEFADDFAAKALPLIQEHGGQVLSFFSRSITRAGYYTGRHFAYNQGYWLPDGVAAEVAVFAEQSPLRTLGVMDQILRDYLKWRPLSFYQVVPNLVDHRIGPSAIEAYTKSISRRAWKRQSKTFVRK